MDSFDLPLFRRFLVEYPFQPATALWRAAEIGHVLRHEFPTGRGLDLGCGDGLLTRIVIDAVGHRTLTGVDIDPRETEVAATLGIYETIHTASGTSIPEPDSSFDFVYSNSVLEHIPDIVDTLGEVSRLLKREGSFLFTVPSDNFHECLRGPIIPGCSRDRYLSDLDSRVAHLRYWGGEEWRAALGAQQMDLIGETKYMSAAIVRRWETISRFTAGVLHALFLHKKRPIEIQRSLGMRRGKRRMPRMLAVIVARTLSLGLAGPALREAPFGCTMMLARKR